MTMKILAHIFLLLISLFCMPLHAAPEVDGVDPLTRTISKVEWQKQAAETKIESPKNVLLLRQAANSMLSELAFNHYGKIHQQKPKNPYAALYYGQAGRFYFEELLPLTSDPTGKRQKAIHAADENLAFAVEKLPKSAYAHQAYGFFLWQFYSQMDKGLVLVRRARNLDSKSPNIAYVIGLMQSNHLGNCYDMVQAERAYRTAIQLDSRFASARYGFSRLLAEKGKYVEAKKQLEVALSLSLKKTKKSSWVLKRLQFLNEKISEKSAE